MRRTSWPWASLLALAAAHAADSPQEIPSPPEILAKCFQASGGPALLEIEVERRTGTLLRGQTGKVPLVTLATASGSWLYHQTFAFGDQVRYGWDGVEGWIQDTEGVASMGTRQRLELQLLLDPRGPSKLHELFPRLEGAGTEQIGDRDAYRVRATSAEGVTTELAFDRDTGLLLRVGAMVFEDYRDVGGIQRPFRVRLGQSDDETHLQMTLEFSDAQRDVAVDESVFCRPEDQLPFAEAPLYRTRREVDVGAEAMDACAGVYQHPELPEVTYTVRRWQNHLMIERTGWNREIEIKPESQTDYFIRFPGIDLHFGRDETGRVTHLEIKSDRTIRAERIG